MPPATARQGREKRAHPAAPLAEGPGRERLDPLSPRCRSKPSSAAATASTKSASAISLKVPWAK